ncbi:MAG: sialate O-acetylesterase [Planctomycetes bacterium]|nr:sialate O-acetylesterase [Planctomycetota bacterium]
MSHRLAVFCLAVFCLALALPLVTVADDEYPASTSKGKVKVFILAGQSNMEGRGFPEPLSWQITQEKFRGRYKHFIKGGDYEAFAKKVAETTDSRNRRQTPKYLWSTRHDVWINYLGRHGDLTVGYGAPREGFGPEFNFGHVVGNYYEEQVLIIKTSWGGRALARGFLPPSSMLSDDEYAKQVAKINADNAAWNKAEPARIEAYNKRVTEQNKTAEKKKPLRKFKPRPMITLEEHKVQFGKDYRNMVAEVHGCLADLGKRFPGYKGQGYQIEGLVWFQGWNDQYQDRWLTYEKNMANFIRDVRKEFKAPEMKFVIGQMGHDGMKPDKEGSPRDYIKKAQAAVPEMAEFKGNSLCVKTDKYWDMEAHAIYTGPGGWSKDVDKWRQFGNDHPYHYYGSPWCFAQIGTAFGNGMLELLKK